MSNLYLMDEVRRFPNNLHRSKVMAEDFLMEAFRPGQWRPVRQYKVAVKPRSRDSETAVWSPDPEGLTPPSSTKRYDRGAEQRLQQHEEMQEISRDATCVAG